MTPKIWITIGILIGSTIGGMLPSLWGSSFLSLSSIFFSTVGGLVGIWAGFKISQFTS